MTVMMMTSTSPTAYDDSHAALAHERARQPMIATGLVILIIGTIGNILAFFILRRKALRIYTTAFMLSLLAICDTACLYLGLLSKVLSYYYRGIDVFRTVLPYSCQIHVFLLYTALHYTSWLLALVSIERFISTWFPHRSLTLCSLRNAKIAALVLLAVIVGYQTHFFYTMELQISDSYSQLQQLSSSNGNNLIDESSILPPQLQPSAVPALDDASLSTPLLPSSISALGGSDEQEETSIGPLYDCKEVAEFEDFHTQIWPILDLVLFCFGPFGVMLVTNILIAWRILQMRREGELVVASTSPARRLSGMTMIMFSCTLTFFALTFPISVYILVRRQYSEQMHVQSNPAVAIVWPAVNLLQYVNNAINFFLYCLTGSMFRRELRRFVQEWLIKVQSLIAFLSATISEEKAERAAAANSNGHLVLIEIGSGNNGHAAGVTTTRANYSRNIIQRLLDRTNTDARQTRTTCVGTFDPYAVTASLPAVVFHRRNSDSGEAANGDNSGNQVKFVNGAEEPLLHQQRLFQQNSRNNECETQIYVGPKHSNSNAKRSANKRKMPKVRAFGSKFAERFRFRFDDSEATSGCYNSSAMDIATVPSLNNNYADHEKTLATIADTAVGTGQENDTIPANNNENNARVNHSNSTSSSSRHQQFINSYRYQRRMTAEEKALLDEFGPHC